jgi:hypothetical protein
MVNKWLAVGSGLIYSGDINKLKLAIFRVMENSRAYPMLVKPSELQLDDLLFLETADKSDYCVLEDFHRNDKGEIDYWVFSESGIPITKQTAMMKMTRALLDKEFKNVNNEGETLLISIKQKQTEK